MEQDALLDLDGNEEMPPQTAESATGELEDQGSLENEININLPEDGSDGAQEKGDLRMEINPGEEDVIKQIQPISKISEFIKQADVKIVDMKWVLNDTFLAILTSNNRVIIFDVLLQVFQIQDMHSPEQNFGFEVRLETTQTNPGV